MVRCVLIIQFVQNTVSLDAALFFEQRVSTCMSSIPKSEVSETRSGNFNVTDGRREKSKRTSHRHTFPRPRTLFNSAHDSLKNAARGIFWVCQEKGLSQSFRPASVDCAMSSPDYAAHFTNNTEYTSDSTLVGVCKPKHPLRNSVTVGFLVIEPNAPWLSRCCVLRDFTQTSGAIEIHRRGGKFEIEAESVLSFHRKVKPKGRAMIRIFRECANILQSLLPWEEASETILATRSAT